MTKMTSRMLGLAAVAVCMLHLAGPALAEEPFFWGGAKCETDADCPQYTVCADYIEECGASLHEWGSDNCGCPDWDSGPGWEEMPCYCHKCDGPNSGPVETGIKLCHMPEVACQSDSDCAPGLTCHKGECRPGGPLFPCDVSDDCDWGWECIDHSWWSVCHDSDAGAPPSGTCCLERVCVPKGWGHPVMGCSGAGGGIAMDVREDPGLGDADTTSSDPGTSKGSGCAVGAAPGSIPWGLVLLALLIMLPVAIPRRRRRVCVMGAVALVLLLGALSGCGSESAEADVNGQDLSIDTSAEEDAADQDLGQDSTAFGTDDVSQPQPGDPEFAAYCQGIVDAFVALYEDLEVPENLMQENPPPVKNGEEFDPNVFFTVLDRLHMEEGWTLDFTYFYNDLGGEPTLVARKTDSSLCQSDPEQPCVSEKFLLHVLVEGTREGWFQLMVLKLMGDQFYREWHGFEGKVILPSHAGLTAWLEGQKKRWSVQGTEDFDEAAMAALKVDPAVDIGDDGVHVNIVYFSRGSGIVRWVADISLEPPYSTAPGGENSHETLFECTWCGVP